MAAGRGRTPKASRAFGRGPRPPADPSSAEAARGRAISLLSRRDYPRRALKARLADSGFEDGAAETAVAGLEDERLVNDARYVEGAIAGRSARGQGPLRIALELRRQGVPEALIREALDPRAAEWAERATELRRRRFGAAAPTSPKERARQVRFLLQRGFSADQVRRALGSRVAEDLEIEDPGSAEDDADAGAE